MSKKNTIFSKNLEKIVQDSYEIGWDALIIADQTLTPRGIICGPKSFIDDFKKFTEEMRTLEQSLEELVEKIETTDVPNDPWADQQSDDIKKNDDNNDDDGGKTWH